MAVQLPLVEELGLIGPFESSQAHGALRVIRHELATKEHDGRPQQLPSTRSCSRSSASSGSDDWLSSRPQ